MPRGATVLRGRDDEADRREVRAINDRASGATATAERLLRYLEEFMIDQPPERSAQDTFELFIGRLNPKLAASTMRTYMDIMSTYGIYPGRTDSARESIRRARFRNGIKRQDQEQEVVGRSETGDWSAMTLIIRTALAGDAPRDLEYRTLFYLSVATGGRLENVMQAHAFDIRSNAVAVKWGRRKVGSPGGGMAVYLHEWSVPPPPDVQNRIATFSQEERWLFQKSSNIASAMNSWLEKRCGRLKIGERFTSTAGRARMSKRLFGMYSKGEIPREVFSELMNHEPKMSIERYHSEKGVEAMSK